MRYVAVGDSFTEGIGDELPDGSPRGWADLVALGLAAAYREISYANLAVRGRLLEPIVTEQVTAALALSPPPTLISINGGGNDILRRTADVAYLARLAEDAVARCGEAGVRVLLLRAPTAALRPGRAPPRSRAHRAVRRLASSDGVSSSTSLAISRFGGRPTGHQDHLNLTPRGTTGSRTSSSPLLAYTRLPACSTCRPIRPGE
jgi:hypothetical protein